MVDSENNDYADLELVLSLLPSSIDSKIDVFTLEKLDQLAKEKNLAASYILGSLYIFGQLPRHYSFDKVYPEGAIRQNALCELDEAKGLSHLQNLLSFGDSVLNLYLEGVYDLYRILEKEGKFFETWDTNLRPQNIDEAEHSGLNLLFIHRQQILLILKSLDIHEAYNSFSLYHFEQYKLHKKEEDLIEAQKYLSQIINNEIDTSYSEILKAKFLLAKIFLTIDGFSNPQEAIKYIVDVDLDDGYIMLIDWAFKQGGEYNQYFYDWVKSIKNDEIRSEYTQKLNIEIIDSPSIFDALNELNSIAEQELLSPSKVEVPDSTELGEGTTESDHKLTETESHGETDGSKKADTNREEQKDPLNNNPQQDSELPILFAQADDLLPDDIILDSDNIMNDEEGIYHTADQDDFAVSSDFNNEDQFFNYDTMND